MAAYVITDVEITNAELYGEFLEKVTATVEGHVASSWCAAVRLKSCWETGRLRDWRFCSSTALSR